MISKMPWTNIPKSNVRPPGTPIDEVEWWVIAVSILEVLYVLSRELLTIHEHAPIEGECLVWCTVKLQLLNIMPNIRCSTSA